jgi:phospholipid transport system substrate-binding protein
LAALIFLLCTPEIARAAATDGAGGFVAALTDRAMVQLTEPGLAEAEQKLRFRALFNEAFDLPEIGRFVLGVYWRRADTAQRSDFLGAFEDMMIYRFLPLFSLYSGEKFEFGAIRPFQDNPDFVSVESKLRRVEGEPIQVSWRVRKSGEGYKIVDIVAEGVSIAVTLRSEYVSVLKRNGGDVEALTQVLREKAKGL